MNERIKQIATHAANYANTYDDAGADIWFEMYNERFAELIVSVCVSTLKKDMELAHIQLIPIDFRMYANGRLQRTIKEHFGIEE